MALPTSPAYGMNDVGSGGEVPAGKFTQLNTSAPVREFGGVAYNPVGHGGCYDNVETYNADQSAQVTLSDVGGTHGVCLRARGQNATRTYYYVLAYAASYLQAFSVVNGTPAQIGITETMAVIATNWANGHKLRAQVVGNQITVYQIIGGSETLIWTPPTNTAITGVPTPGAAGFFAEDNTGIDDFIGNNVGGGGGGSALLSMMQQHAAPERMYRQEEKRKQYIFMRTVERNSRKAA